MHRRLEQGSEALRKRIGRRIGFYPTLKLTRPAGTGEKPRRAPVRLDGQSVRTLERRFPYGIAVSMQKRLREGHKCYALQNDAGEYESFGGETIVCYFACHLLHDEAKRGLKLGVRPSG